MERRKKLSPEETAKRKAYVLKRLAHGASKAQIAREINMSIAFVSNLIKEHEAA